MKIEDRTKDNPWKLKTPPLSSEYEMYVEKKMVQKLLFVWLVKQRYFMITTQFGIYTKC